MAAPRRLRALTPAELARARGGGSVDPASTGHVEPRVTSAPDAERVEIIFHTIDWTYSP